MLCVAHLAADGLLPLCCSGCLLKKRKQNNNGFGRVVNKAEFKTRRDLHSCSMAAAGKGFFNGSLFLGLVSYVITLCYYGTKSVKNHEPGSMLRVESI